MAGCFVMTTATARATVAVYPSRLGNVGFEGTCPRAYEALRQAVNKTAKHQRLSMYSKKYMTHWVVYLNGTKSLPEYLAKWVAKSFDLAPQQTAEQHRAEIDQRRQRENVVLSLRAKAWQFSRDQLVNAAAELFEVSDLPKRMSHLLDVLSKDIESLEAIINHLVDSADTDVARAVKCTVVYDDPDDPVEDTEDNELIGEFLQQFVEEFITKALPLMLPPAGVSMESIKEELRSLTIRKLKARASQLGIKSYGNLRKEELVAAIAPVFLEVEANL